MARVQRIAIVVPDSADLRWRVAYARIEATAHDVLAQRPDIRFVERTALGAVLEEHALQVSGQVADESAIRVGRLSGADGLLLVRIDGPSIHDLLLTHHVETLPPVVLTAKLLLTESGEVAWQRAVSVSLQDAAGWSLGESLKITSLRQAVDQAIERFKAELDALVVLPIPS
ncbi:MAG: hypothetical protein AB1411_15785 [Nitrospirota bacterium]